ncbi:MAG TPA: alpha/beta fold hydrolase [Albitalea sp.]|jgi:pimeloyl-ACP methyl ester carboxylesterase|nr:alpha/beta fold hydrolase [Albitalea sp.]
MALQLVFEEAGSGAPLLLLHGLFGSSTNWRSVARQLATSHRVISVNLRNHGASPWADSMSYVEMAGDVMALIERLGLQRPAVVGHSMGGKTAMALALDHPGLLGRLVVVDIAPVRYADRLSSYARAMASIDTLAASSRAEVQRLLESTIPDAATAAFLVQNLVHRNEHFDWRINLAAITASMGELSGFPDGPAARCFPGPTTLIVGARSDYVSAEDRAVFRTHFPRLQVIEIAEAGHWVHADRPAEFIAALRGALA